MRGQVVDALNAAERQPKPPLTEMFTDVYEKPPWHLQEQEAEVIDFVRRNPGLVPSDVPVSWQHQTGTLQLDELQLSLIVCWSKGHIPLLVQKWLGHLEMVSELRLMDWHQNSNHIGINTPLYIEQLSFSNIEQEDCTCNLSCGWTRPCSKVLPAFVNLYRVPFVKYDADCHSTIC